MKGEYVTDYNINDPKTYGSFCIKCGHRIPDAYPCPKCGYKGET
jgi:ribosomal protein L40E